MPFKTSSPKVSPAVIAQQRFSSTNVKRAAVLPHSSTVVVVNNKCGKCTKTVYKAEEVKFEYLVFHRLCFGTWKREHDKAINDKKHREYYRKPDVYCTQNEGDLNNKIYYDLQD